MRPVLITLMPLKRVVDEPCDTALTWLGWPLPSKKEPLMRQSRSSQMAAQAFQKSWVFDWYATSSSIWPILPSLISKYSWPPNWKL